MGHTGAFAQANRVISTREGLPQSFISGLVQDRAGFIWVGTRNGLSRYDGISFKTFQHNVADSSTLASNLIICIKYIRNKIWIEYDSGDIDQFDPVTEKIVHYIRGSLQLDYLRKSWTIDSQGHFLAISLGNGALIYDPAKQKYTRIIPDGAEHLWSLREGDAGEIWALSERGLLRITGRRNKSVELIASVRLDFHQQGDTYRMSVPLFRRSNGEWMWGDRHTLYIYSLKTLKLRSIPLPGSSNYGILWIGSSPYEGEYFEREGTFYRYDDIHGISAIDTEATQGAQSGQSFVVDKSGVLWVGTNAKGLILLDLNTPFFPAYPNKYGFAGDVLMKELGVSISKVFDWSESDNQYTSPGYHLRSAYAPDGSLWVGLKENVIRYDPKTKGITHFARISEVANRSERGIGIKGISVNPQGIPVVIGYNGNVLIYHQENKNWEVLLDKEQLRVEMGIQMTPRDILCDDERLWITTENNGLVLYDLKKKSLHRMQEGILPTGQLLGLCADPTRRDLLWIGSHNGLILLNKRNLKVSVFNTTTGLPDNTVYSLLADDNGFLWFGTNKGLCRFHPRTHQIRVFQTRHGLPEEEFNRFHQLKLPDGRLAFGGTTGWTSFNPLRIRDDFYKPDVVLINLKVNNKEVIPGKAEILPTQLNELDALTLPYDQNTLTISFAGLQFNQPQDLNYRYRLRGYDQEWIQAGGQPQAIYTKIPSGEYTFEVEASNTAGRWSGKIKQLTIIIHAPWWQTWWAYLSYVLLLAGAFWYWFQLKLARLALQKSIELKQQEASQLRKLADMKTRFFTNVTHDFRTPLTLILSPLSGLIADHPDLKSREKLSSVKRNAEQLLTLINQLLDFSKLDAEVMTIDESRGNVTTFVGNVVQLFAEEAKSRGITLDSDGFVKGDHWFDAVKVESILSNLIGNALKFTSSGGKVTVCVESIQNEIIFSVKDTGIGIHADQLPHIFDRYYQADQARSSEKERRMGTGIGLAFVKELAQVLRGRTEVESVQGKGSTFRVCLPLQSADDPGADTTANAHGMAGAIVQTDQETVRILLVEDNKELADFIADSLPMHYEVIRAVNGADGLQSATENIPDLIISDVMMPVMDGFAFCKEVKNNEQTSHIPVVLLTAKTGTESKMEGLTLGADDYLSKPFHVPELNLRIYNLLERQIRLRDKIRRDLSAPEPEGSLERIQNPFLLKFHILIEQNLDNSSVGVEELAQQMSISRSQLHRKLKAIAGLSVVEIIRNYRLKRAAEFLREGCNSAEAAYRSGFDSPAYFSKCFRDFYGITPSEFVAKG